MKFNQILVVAFSVAVAALNVTEIRAMEIQGQEFNQQSTSQIAIEGSTTPQQWCRSWMPRC